MTACFVLISAWALSAALARDVAVTKVWPDKLAYRFAAPGTVAVTVSNSGTEPRAGELKVMLYNRLDRETVLSTQPLNLAAGETTVIEIPFATGTKADGAEYGYEARVVLSAEGQADSVGREFFMVTDNPLKIGHLTIPTAATDHRHGWWGQSVARGVGRMRERYFIMAETPFWAPCDFSELTTEREFWTSGQAGRFNSLKGMQALADSVHDIGGWIVIYANKWSVGPVGFEHARKHPDWYHWGLDWYGCKFDLEMFEWIERAPYKDGEWKEQKDGGIWAICPLIARPEIADFGISQIVGSINQFGWDGIRFDNFGWYVDNVKDILGNPAVEPGTDIPRLEADLVRRIRAAGKEAVSHFVYGNNLDMWPTSIDKASPKWLAEAADGGLVMNEGMHRIGTAGNPLNNWAHLRAYLRQAIPVVRKAGGYPYGIIPACPRVHATDLQPPRSDRCILYAVLMASGMHLCYDVGPDYGHYMRLYARYCGLLYDDTMLFVDDPEEMLSVTTQIGDDATEQLEAAEDAPDDEFDQILDQTTNDRGLHAGLPELADRFAEPEREAPPGPRDIWWKEYVRRRDLADGTTQIIVHLINASTREFINENNPAPRPHKDVAVRLVVPDNVTVARAFALSADGSDGPVSKPLALTRDDDSISVTVPELQHWTIVVFEGSA